MGTLRMRGRRNQGTGEIAPYVDFGKYVNPIPNMPTIFLRAPPPPPQLCVKIVFYADIS